MTIQTITVIAVIIGAVALALVALALRMRRSEQLAEAAPAAVPSAAVLLPEAPAPAAVMAAPDEAAVEALASASEPPMELVSLAEPASLAQPAMLEPIAPTTAPAAPAPARADGEPLEVLRILRDRPQGSLVVEIGGQRFRRVTEIKDQKQGLSLVDVVIDLQQFVGLDVIVPLAAEHALQQPRQPEAAPMQRPSLNPIKQMLILKEREVKKSREKDAAPQTGSIVEEIEAILVKRLVGSPFEGRSIHMRPGLHGGAHIDVDGQAYESIEDVADPSVKDFLKTVIAEWEREAAR